MKSGIDTRVGPRVSTRAEPWKGRSHAGDDEDTRHAIHGSFPVYSGFCPWYHICSLDARLSSPAGMAEIQIIQLQVSPIYRSSLTNVMVTVIRR